jgi:hypothetical protein
MAWPGAVVLCGTLVDSTPAEPVTKMPTHAVSTCIVHVGMPKTGTTSIQDSLYVRLADPRFLYIGLDHPNASDFLAPILGVAGQTFRYRQVDYSPAYLRRLAIGYETRLRKALWKARDGGRCPIISGEFMWNQKHDTLQRLRDLLATEGFSARIIAYVRPIKSFLESWFQEIVKLGVARFDPMFLARAIQGRPYSYSARLEALESVFGADRVTVRPFARAALAEGCVVRDFCATLGITFDPRLVINSNESLCADAVKMLYAYNLNGRVSSMHPRMGARHYMMVTRMQELPGAPIRFHSSLLGEARHEIEAQNRAMQRKYGFDISEHIEASDAGPCIRSEEDVLRFSRASLDWLSEVTGTTPIRSTDGESAAIEVAHRVARLRNRISPRVFGRLLARRLRRDVRRTLRRD